MMSGPRSVMAGNGELVSQLTSQLIGGLGWQWHGGQPMAG
jgi:hypothetical protein